MPPVGIHIKNSDRAFIVGTTGSGKTTLARALLCNRPDVVIVDPKGGFEWDSTYRPKAGGLITDDFALVQGWEGPAPIIYRPTIAVAAHGMEPFWHWVWERRHTLVYIDEAAMLCPTRGVIPGGLARAIQQGRQREISVWSATQRPANIPVPLLSESEHVFTFRLRNPDDLKRMADYTDPAIRNEPVSGHDFYYYGDRENVLLRTNLNALSLRR